MKNKQFEVLQRASLFLQRHKREPKIAEILLQHHLSLNKTEFILNMQKEIPSALIQKFESDIERHAKTGIPYQHLIGYEYFYGRKFHVSKNALIPRPETEELLERAISHIKKNKTNELTAIDIGTGSGVIAITLALELPKLTVFASDLSNQALELAQKNAEKLEAKVRFFHGSYLAPFIERGIKTDILISNPPYISYREKDDLSETVAKFDPELALFAGKDGLLAYERIISQARTVLSPEGSLLFEIGHTQGEQVKQLILDQFPESEVEIFKDLNHLDRIILAKL